MPMLIPRYWAEGRKLGRINGRQVTVRRFGWSDVGQSEAQTHADERAAEAFACFERGESPARRELKRAYSGADGVPIREEIVAEHGDVVITRNSYGALCLNTPDVLFADIDFASEIGCRSVLLSTVVIAAIGIAVGAIYGWWKFAIGLCMLAPFLGLAVATVLLRSREKLAGGPGAMARRRIDSFLAAHPEWHLRLYRTPVGFRVLAMHRTFEPHEQAVRELFDALGSDPIYVRMCLVQHCFRARVSPKPWRVGMGRHIRPVRAVWPITEEKLPDRIRWVEDYERQSHGYASCQFVESLGSSTMDSKARAVQELHDRMCRAESALPIA